MSVALYLFLQPEDEDQEVKVINVIFNVYFVAFDQLTIRSWKLQDGNGCVLLVTDLFHFSSEFLKFL